MIDDAAVLVIGSGNYFTAPVGTPAPEDLLAPESPWENVGHTSLDDVFGVTSDGGDATVLGTLQNKSLRTSYSARTETLAFTLQQFNAAGLRLFYGSNAPTLPNGMIGVPNDPQPTQCAFLVVFLDGDNHFGFWAPKSEIYRADDMAMSDTESLAGMPLGVKPMAYQSNAFTYAVTPLGDNAVPATGATAGIPGAFTPTGAALPADLTTLQAGSVTANPTTAWTAGQYIVLGDGSNAHWSSTAWAANAAS